VTRKLYSWHSRDVVWEGTGLQKQEIRCVIKY